MEITNMSAKRKRKAKSHVGLHLWRVSVVGLTHNLWVTTRHSDEIDKAIEKAKLFLLKAGNKNPDISAAEYHGFIDA